MYKTVYIPPYVHENTAQFWFPEEKTDKLIPTGHRGKFCKMLIHNEQLRVTVSHYLGFNCLKYSLKFWGFFCQKKTLWNTLFIEKRDFHSTLDLFHRWSFRWEWSPEVEYRGVFYLP